MPGTLKKIGPLALTTTMTTNVYAGAAGSALIFDQLRQINVANKTGAAATFSLWLGATGANAAGTELFTAVSVPANQTSSFFFQPGLRMLSTDFLVGGASANTTLTITVLTEQSVL
jgi:hypothetical protein